MNVPTRLGVYAAGLAALFAVALAAGAALVPDSTVASWTAAAQDRPMDHAPTTPMPAETGSARGLSLEQDGYLLGEVAAPDRVGTAGLLSFQVRADDGNPLTAYTTSHDKDLHLIVVRSDGTQFRHVHPTMSPAGTWSIPWTWNAAGTYRVFADFVPADRAGSAAANVTVSRTVDVAGDERDTDTHADADAGH